MSSTDPRLTHIDADGRSRMVDVSEKDFTSRRAVAEGSVSMSPAALKAALTGAGPKGNVISAAEIAGIMAAKRTSDLVPMCHPLPLTSLKVEVTSLADESGLRVEAYAMTTGQTGVEMEALTAVSIACLTLYDMLKSIDKAMVIGGVRLLEKTGGKSGDYRAPPA